MMSLKQTLPEGYKQSIKRNEEKIAEYSKPCDAWKRRIRALERDSLRKRNEELKQKPVKVPQFVADWIEYCKRGLSIRQAMSQVHVSNEVDDWLMGLDEDGAFLNQEIFARVWLDGYEVEKEPMRNAWFTFLWIKMLGAG